MVTSVLIGSVILLLALAQLALSQHWYETDDSLGSDGKQPIVMIKPIQDMYVEEYETQVIQMSQYVSGGLVNFRLDVEYHNDSESPDEVAELSHMARQTIQVTKGSASVSEMYLRNSDLASVMDPFPRSTVLLDDSYGNLMMYFIDRSFYFNSYCFEGYLDNNIVQGHFIELDRTIITGQCSNLKNVRINDEKKYLIFFCLSMDKKTRVSKLTVVQVRDFEQLDVAPKILYYTQDYDVTKIDFQYPVRFVSNFSRVNSGEDFGLFMARMKDDHPGLWDLPQLLLVNFTIFDEIFASGQPSLYQPSGGLFIKTAFLNLTSKYNEKSIIDYKTIFLRDKSQEALTDSPHMSIALVIEGYGMLLCNISNYRDLIVKNVNFTCLEDNNSFLHLADGAISVHHEPFNPETKLFLISAQPVMITEYEIGNFRNSFISKVYMAQREANKRYIATSELTVNQKWVVLGIRDIYTSQIVLRVFARNTTFFRVVMQDIPLPPLSRMEFVQFPNYFFNSMIFRDERSVNITKIFSQQLIVNRSESAMEEAPKQQKLNGRTFIVKMSHESSQERRVQQLAQFKVTFLDQYSTEIYPSPLVDDGNLNIFYSCGDKNFKFDLNQLYIGPEYILSLDSTKQNGSDTSYFQFQNSREVRKFRSSLNSNECEQSILVPVSSQRELSTMLMVCVTIKNARFVSYLVNIDTSNDQPTSQDSELIIDNDISIPSSSLMKFAYDTEKRIIIAIVKITDPTMKEYIQEQFQVHYLQIDQTLSWKNMHSLNLTGFNTRDRNSSENFIDHFSYSEELQKGMIAENNLDEADWNQALFMVFDVDLITFRFTNLKRYPAVQIMGLITKAEITNDRMFVILTTKNVMQVFQIFSEQIKAINQEKSMKEKVEILDFDIFDMRYLVLYNNDSTTDIYELDQGLDYTHRMRLPKYKKFENYVFKNYHGKRKPKRDYFERTLALMMTNSANNHTALLVYRLDEPQHNSLYISNHSISDQLIGSDYSWIVLTGDSEDVNMHYFGIVSDKRFQIIQVKYYDTITVNMSKNQDLISQCKDTIMMRGMEDDFVQHSIQQMSIHPFFEDDPDISNNTRHKSSKKQNITVTIQSANLGLALQPIAKNFRVSYQHS